jgi:hypothetical protein
MTIQELKAIEFMHRFGGAFVRALAHASAAADPDNFQRLKVAFPEIWETYENWPAAGEEVE